MKKMTLYTFDNHEHTVEVADDFKIIHVTVITGDELATIVKADGSKEKYDAAELDGNWRNKDFYDGYYEVTPENFKDWQMLRVSKESMAVDEAAAYQRLVYMLNKIKAKGEYGGGQDYTD